MPRKRTGHLGMTEDARQRRRHGIGGSDAKILMSGDDRAIEKLWAEKRGEAPLWDSEEILIAHMGTVMEDLNLDWFEKTSGLIVSNEQETCVYPDWEIARCTLDGRVFKSIGGPSLGILEAKFMMPYHWSLPAAIVKYWPQLQHNMMVTGEDYCWFTVLTGAAQHVYDRVEADPFYQIRLLQAEQAFWDCVVSGVNPITPEPLPDPVLPTRVLDMTGSNEWAAHAADLLETSLHLDRHDAAKKAIKLVMPKDAKEASGHGVTLKRAKNGAISFKLDDQALADARARVESF
ncbi:YqaJ viral recombinase family protein [Methylobacterium indicum]|uniref:YqaJ viral recombinase domain-containing protein n=1 Tax=Methylobacterium indicum TaxID=1775910 RepID=A0A8H8X0G9_9HYPH|nr:YqaJ viral recombinase family protein [Methylobacterium indicum]BCM87848.1 hypothetical protein mvi_63090 [Methylobacterium indicum]